MSLLMRNGKFLTQFGKLLRASAASYAAFLECCCGVPGCSCAEQCDAPNYRIIIQSIGIPPGTLCHDLAEYTGTLTEQDVGTIPEPQPCCNSVARYWSKIVTTPCEDTGTTLIEVACCDLGGLSQFLVRLNGGSWFFAEVCQPVQYQAIGFVLSADPACNTGASAYIQIWCGTDPGKPDCDLSPPTQLCP